MSRSQQEPCVFVIHGGRGDLSRRKLLPALAHLVNEGRIHPKSLIVGVGRDTETSDDDFRNLALESLKEAGVAPEGDKADFWKHQLFYQGVPDGSE
ncbi:MAG: glucose-6-phosphate dehydrogenase, partial [Acidobacteriota bacterium]